MSNTTMNQAKRILETHTSGELAAKLGIKSTNFSGLKSGKRPLTEKMAARIVEAYGGKAQEKKPAKKPPTEKKPEPVTVTSKGKKLDLSNRRTADAFLEEIEKQAQLDQFESMARSVVSKVVREEVVPALNEKIGRCIEGAVIDPGVKVKIAELEGKIKLLEGELAELKEAEPTAIAVSKDEAGETKVAVDGVLHVEDGGEAREVPLSDVSFAGDLPPIPDGIQPGPSTLYATLYEVNEGLDKHRWWRRSK